MTDTREKARIGLCWTCRWRRTVVTRRGSTFYRCARAEADERFPRYPQLPVRSCDGYEALMLYVVLLHYTAPLAAVDEVRAAHLAHVERYAAQGVFVAWARRSLPVGGVLVAATDRVTLDAIVAADPYLQAGVARAEIVEFNPANVRLTLGA
ncbi:MAG TPA: YciI family protein [Gemmatimonadales bacterium]|nr:YciI family protein [Gemmatimonadales bacterium]